MSTVIDTLITDRTVADAARAAELSSIGFGRMTEAQRAEFLVGMKGSYNTDDLNRVGEACEYLRERFASFGYAVPGYVSLRTDWAVDEFPAPDDMVQYLSTVNAIKAVFETAVAVPETMEHLTVDGANDIERLLVAINESLESIGKVFIRAGMPWAYAGVGYYIKN